MLDVLLFLTENPFTVVLAIFVLTLIAFFAFEIFAEHKRLEKNYHIKRIFSGVFVIGLAFFILYAPILSAPLYTGSGTSISNANNICDEGAEETGCTFIMYANYLCYFLLFIGVSLIIAGIVSVK